MRPRCEQDKKWPTLRRRRRLELSGPVVDLGSSSRASECARRVAPASRRGLRRPAAHASEPNGCGRRVLTFEVGSV